MIRHIQCKDCGKSRAAGWILVNGQCAECAPDAFDTRRKVLKAQAVSLMTKEANASEADAKGSER